MAELTEFFFPYQKRWLLDKSKVKIFEKSRRIGGTWVQSFEDVQDCIEQPGLKVFFSSADMTDGIISSYAANAPVPRISWFPTTVTNGSSP